MPTKDHPQGPPLVRELLAFDLGERSRPPDDPWWRVARGELTPEELVAARDRLDGADPDALRRHAELYAPPSPETQRRTIAELHARFFAEPSAGHETPAGSDGESTGAPRADPEDGPVDLTAARRRRRVQIALGTALAVAAAAVLTWSLAPRDRQTGEPLPAFSPEWSNQYRGAMRGNEAASDCPRYRLEDRLKIQLRPDVELADDVVIAAIARTADGPARKLAIDPTLSPAGVITIEQPVEPLELAPGRWDISLFISRGGDLSLAELAEFSAAEHPDIAVVRTAVCIEP